jgi:MoaA/NifB/PqqE/SkfB family radical SAM enzyme
MVQASAIAEQASAAYAATPFRRARKTLKDGGPGFCQFAINNACNAGCEFCSFNINELPKSLWRFAPLAQAERAIDVLARHDVRYLVITGGEPLLHPHIHEILGHAAARGMVVLMVTNGSRLNPKRIRALREAGLSSVLISIDAASAERHEQNRKLAGVCARIQEANKEFKRHGIQSTASVTMSRLIGDYAELPPFLKGLGFDSVTFSYPLTALNSSFLGAADSDLVSYGKQELLDAFEQVKGLKSRMHVLNPKYSLEEMQRFLRGEPQRFACLGGYKYFYLDWDLLLWRCHYWEEPMCSVFDFDGSQRVRDGCTRCMIDCYRDASVMQHAAVAIADARAQASAGHWLQAARTVFSRSNFDSLRCVAESRRWIKDL